MVIFYRFVCLTLLCLCLSFGCSAKDLAKAENVDREAMWSGCLGENYSQVKQKALSGDIAAIRHYMELSDCSPDHVTFELIAERGAQNGDEFVTNFYISELIDTDRQLKALGYAIVNSEKGDWASRFYVFDIVNKNHIKSLRDISECYVVLNYESDPKESYYPFIKDWVAYSLDRLKERRISPALYSIYHINMILKKEDISNKKRAELKLEFDKLVAAVKESGESNQSNKAWSSKDFCK